MKDHYNMSDEAFSKLNDSGITMLDLVKSEQEFRVCRDTDLFGTIGVLNLMYFIDRHGNFLDNNKQEYTSVLSQIARAVFDSLLVKDKFQVLSYIDHYEEGFKFHSVGDDEEESE